MPQGHPQTRIATIDVQLPAYPNLITDLIQGLESWRTLIGQIIFVRKEPGSWDPKNGVNGVN
jgi:hypothetical protein